MLLQIDSRRIEPDILVVSFTGKITVGRESQRIETMVQDLLRRNEKKLIFDLMGVDYIDSAGLGMLTFSASTVREAGGAIGLVCGAGKVDQLIKITRLNSILPFFSTVEAACQSLTPS